MHCSVLWLLVWTGMLVARGKRKKEQVWLETVIHGRTLWGVHFNLPLIISAPVCQTYCVYSYVKASLVVIYVIALFLLQILFSWSVYIECITDYKNAWGDGGMGGWVVVILHIEIGSDLQTRSSGYQYFLNDGFVGIWLQSCKDYWKHKSLLTEKGLGAELRSWEHLHLESSIWKLWKSVAHSYTVRDTGIY